MLTHRISTLVLAAGLALSACGGGDEPAPTTATTPAPAATPAPAPAAAPVAYDGEDAEITLSPVGDEMKYAQTEFTVHPGQTVRLIFNNTATSPAMQHNVAILKSRDDVQTVGTAAASAADTDYIAPRTAGKIIAHTPMSAPGETVEVTFTAPAAGDYPYICTYPGHYIMMKGTMHVVP